MCLRAKVGYKTVVDYLRGVESITGALLGLAAAAGATLFPGLQNMANVSVSLRGGRRAGYRFALGLSLTFTLQAGLAVLFANYFARHPGILVFMKQWAIPVFLLLAAFFFVKGYRARAAQEAPANRPYQGSPFARGVVLALMNLLVLPYFFALSGWLLAAGLLDAAPLPRLMFVLGAGAGAVIVYGAYARLATWMDRKAHFLTRNMNFLLGGILVGLALIQGVRIYLVTGFF